MLLALVSVIAVAQGQLESSDISIDLNERSAVILARYQIVNATRPVRFVLIKLRGQEIRLDAAPGDSSIVDVHSKAGLYEFTVIPSNSGIRTVSVRYEVSGKVDRIPILNPDVPTDPATGAVSIKIRGVPASAALSDAFPRLVRDRDGSVSATLPNLPSVVRLPAAMGDWSTNRLSDLSVALLIVLSSILWLLRQRYVSARHSDSG